MFSSVSTLKGTYEKSIIMKSKWQPSESVNSDARTNAGLSFIWFENPPILIHIYYVDKAGALQELRGGHASYICSNGILGVTRFRATDTYSAYPAQFQGRCGDRAQLGWVFYESDNCVCIEGPLIL